MGKIEFRINHSLLLVHVLEQQMEEFITVIEETYGKTQQKQRKCIERILREFINGFKEYSEKQVFDIYDSYFSSLDGQNDTSVLTTEILKEMTSWLYSTYMNTDEYKKKIKDSRLEYLPSYVYDKKTDDLIQCELGCHKLAILELCNKHLSNKYKCEQFREIPEKYYVELDQYIKGNILIKGEFNGKSSYTKFSKLRRVTE